MSTTQTYLPQQAGERASPEFWRGIVSCTPVLLGIVPYALVLGAQAAQKGLSVVEVPLMTGLNFAGGSEFAAIQLWTSPPHILLIVAITFLVNSRHLLMGAALAPFLRQLPKRKALPALFFMCDESWALGLADSKKRASAGSVPGIQPALLSGSRTPLLSHVGSLHDPWRRIWPGARQRGALWLRHGVSGCVPGAAPGHVERYGPCTPLDRQPCRCGADLPSHSRSLVCRRWRTLRARFSLHTVR